MESVVNRVRWISTSWFPLVVSIIFLGAFYGAYFSLLPQGVTIESIKLSDFVSKYAVLVPAVYGLLALLKVYILGALKWIVRRKHWSGWLVVLLLIYGASLALGIQLHYFEPRNHEVARFLIDWYSMPLLMASGVVLGVAFLGIFLKKKV